MDLVANGSFYCYSCCGMAPVWPGYDQSTRVEAVVDSRREMFLQATGATVAPWGWNHTFSEHF